MPASGEPGERRRKFQCIREPDGLILDCISAAGYESEIPEDLAQGERVILVEKAPAVLVGPPEPESLVFVESVKRRPKRTRAHTFRLAGDYTEYTVFSKEPVTEHSATLAFNRWAEEHGSEFCSLANKQVKIEYELWRQPGF